MIQQAIEWNDFSVVVERRNRLELASADIHDVIQVQRDIVARHIERRRRYNSLNLRRQHAVFVRKLESSRERERLAGADVVDPHDRATDSSAGMNHAMVGDSLAASGRIGRQLDNGVRWQRSIEVDGPGQTNTSCHRLRLVFRRRLGYDSGTRSNASLLELRRLRSISFLVCGATT